MFSLYVFRPILYLQIILVGTNEEDIMIHARDKARFSPAYRLLISLELDVFKVPDDIADGYLQEFCQCGFAL